MSDIAKRFLDIFSGLERAHGSYQLSGVITEKGKRQGNALTKQEPPTEELWLKHLNGEYGLGIFPLRDDGMCKWGAIDVDIYNLDFEKLETTKIYSDDIFFDIITYMYNVMSDLDN